MRKRRNWREEICLLTQKKKYYGLRYGVPFWIFPGVVRYFRLNCARCINILLRGFSVCQPLRSTLYIYATQPATNTHTHIPLCKPFFAHLSEKTCQSTNYSSGYTSPLAHCNLNDIGTQTPISQENEVFIIFYNVFIESCFSEAIWIRISFFFAVSYIPVKV